MTELYDQDLDPGRVPPRLSAAVLDSEGPIRRGEAWDASGRSWAFEHEGAGIIWAMEQEPNGALRPGRPGREIHPAEPVWEAIDRAASTEVRRYEELASRVVMRVAGLGLDKRVLRYVDQVRGEMHIGMARIQAAVEGLTPPVSRDVLVDREDVVSEARQRAARIDGPATPVRAHAITPSEPPRTVTPGGSRDSALMPTYQGQPIAAPPSDPAEDAALAERMAAIAAQPGALEEIGGDPPPWEG